MATAKETLIGMYQWNNDLFHDMVLPEGIDKDLLIKTIILRGGEFEVLYADPDFMQMSIGVWSSKWFRTFAEWLRGTQATWNPIYNYDRFEDVRDENRKTFDSKTTADYSNDRTANLTDKRTANLEDKRTANLQEKRTANLEDKRTANLDDKTTFLNDDTTSQTIDGTTQHDVSAYDQTGYTASSKDTINNGTSKVSHTGTVDVATTGTDTMNHTGTDTNNITGTDSTAHTGTDTSTTTGTDKYKTSGTLSDTGGHENTANIHTAHMYGNIGVKDSAEMLAAFYDISKWNLFNHIADVFVEELLIPIY